MTARPGVRRLCAAVGVIAVLAIIGCRGRGAAVDTLAPMLLPDISKMQTSVQQQIRDAYTSATQPEAGGERAMRAAAYGELGRLLLAAEYAGAAEPAFLNAQTLAPTDPRWPYYLGHVYRFTNDLPRASVSFERALQLKPGDEAALIHLGNVSLERTESDAAEASFSKALSLNPRSAAALAGLGRAALAQRNYRRAAAQLEAALGISPGASSLHYQLAMAYRGLGDLARAEAHIKQRGDVEVTPTDPLMQTLAGLLQGSDAFELRGDRALDNRDFATAVALFREGAAKAPDNASIRQKLGTVLFLTGDAAGAAEQLEAAVRLEPSLAVARYSLGVLRASTGRHEEAIGHLSAAVTAEPAYVEARLALADELRLLGRLEDSMVQYGQALQENPGLSRARFGYAMALVRLGRYQDARKWLTEAVGIHPGQSEFPHALARVLAAAPDARARDGRQALALVQGLVKEQQTIDLAETMAMALAEVGRFDEAAAMQREAMSAATGSGLPELARALATNLARYQRREPCRTPWRDDDPVHAPGPALDVQK